MSYVNAGIELEKIKLLGNTGDPSQSFSFGERVCLYTQEIQLGVILDVFFWCCNDRAGLVLKKGMEILVLPVLSPVCTRSVTQKFVILDRLLWAVVFGGKKDCIFFLAAHKQ